MKLEAPPDHLRAAADAAVLKARLEHEGWLSPNRSRRTGLSITGALGVLRAAGAPRRIERTGRLSIVTGQPAVELWMPAWVLRVLQLWTGRPASKVTDYLAALVRDDELRAALFALADLGRVDEGRLLVRRAVAAQPPAERDEPMDWTTALMVKGFYVVCERGDDEVWRRSGPHHATKEGATAAIRALMLSAGYLRVAMLDRNGKLMKTPRPRVRFPK